MRDDVAKDLERDGRLRAVMADIERSMDKIYGVKTYNGPVLFDHSGNAMKSTIPLSVFDKREPWQRIKVDTGKGMGQIFTKGEVDDDE